ncbi:protoglobin domain-containing protein [Chitinophaga sp. MM2321]|uniref:protoglobin domain-containing protein n=1 Tax=Chitinophaga sp. MM2321 TaxID=3137178 RepID=UPI0032D59216
MNNAAQRASVIPDPKRSSIDALTLVKLKRMMLFTYEDEQYLTKAGAVLAPHAEEILDKWHEQLLANNYLAHYFISSGTTDPDYMQSLRPHFRGWINQLCERPENRRWSEFEERIITQLQSKNVPIDDLSPLSTIYLRYMSTFIFPISEAGRYFLNTAGYTTTETARMHQAWYKAVSFSLLLWTYPPEQSV